MFVERVTPRSMEEIRQEFPAIARRLGLVFVGTHNIKDYLIRSGHYLAGDFVVFEFSYPETLRSALQYFPQAACLAPARLAVFKRGGKTRLCTFRARRVTRSSRMPKEAAAKVWKSACAFDRKIDSLLRELCIRRPPGRATEPREV